MEKLIKQLSECVDADYRKMRDEYGKSIQYVEYEPPYFRFKNSVSRVNEGTVAFLTGKGIDVIHGYRSIPRALVITASFKKFFKEAYAEEKMNGYNVRTASVDGEIVAITRKGLVCPYTTMRVESAVSARFFKDHPNLVLCGEVVGLQNPYQEKSYPEDREFGYYVFDVMRRDGTLLKRDEKLALIKKYSLKAVRDFGKVSGGKSVLELVRKLGEQGREGVVLKSPDGRTALKYTANQSTNEDLRYAFSFYDDYGNAFIYPRLVREAFQAYEARLTKSELEKEAAALGKSMLIPMVETIKKIAGGQEANEPFKITVPDEEFGFDFIENLRSLGVHVSVLSIKKRNKKVIMSLARRYPATNDTTKYFLNGGTFHE
ncbi:MAG: RNA ligase [archaeon]